MSVLARWTRQPQQVPLRKLLFQVHLWAGLGIGLYIVLVCITGSFLVYRNELYQMFSPMPVIVEGRGPTLGEAALTRLARRAFPAYEIDAVRPGETPNHAVEVVFLRGSERKRRLFHPFTGADLGDPVPAGFRFTVWVQDLHDNLLFGTTGRRLNGVGALLVLLVALTGAVVWWPGVTNWRRSLTVDVHANWKLLNWSLHGAMGFWTLGFILLWGVTGTYLSFPRAFAEFFDSIDPLDEAHPVARVSDSIQYWLAYLHFGRLGGRGIPGCGRGLCDTLTKLTWAVVGLVPPVLFVTGAIMWWNRVVSPGTRRASRRDEPPAYNSTR